MTKAVSFSPPAYMYSVYAANILYHLGHIIQITHVHAACYTQQLSSSSTSCTHMLLNPHFLPFISSSFKLTCATALERLFEENHHSVHVDNRSSLQVTQSNVRVFLSLGWSGNLRRNKAEFREVPACYVPC